MFGDDDDNNNKERKMYDLRKLKVCNFASQETVCFEAELVKDGKLVAHVSNEGRGGPDRMHFVSPVARCEFEAYLDALPMEPSPYPEISKDDIKVSAEVFINRLIVAIDAKKRLKRWCKTKVVYKTKACKKGEWIVVSTQPTPQAFAQVRAKIGDDLVAIANLDIDKAASLDVA